ncbi:immunity 26/phosphotriesterase HocA family protein [Paenibacillus thiaminolyticus]|uniref:Imm26 family immunity protein n=1 Tax=Paenibacillus thiaminolyticus TaxID=49283 RepID=UPI00232ACF4B|nr:Imm26 family immunity protein [Paenibacillus thiaminolyticus]WCF09568.1 immunity 26/phosphotriesterase HocA family protein [Paenibacillus thiaminolyticus]WII38779.1 Imm26 family immunity protein [Paenibacillus thiaminolyticus]
MVKKKSTRIKLGDVYAIPLPDGRVGFGRRFKDASIAIYQHIGDSMEDTPPDEEYQFIVGVYDDVLKSGQWPVIENRPFKDEEEAWPPPACIIDKLSGGYSIYQKGEIRQASKEECEGLEIAAVWEGEHIIDRIMGDDRWHKDPLA